MKILLSSEHGARNTEVICLRFYFEIVMAQEQDFNLVTD